MKKQTLTALLCIAMCVGFVPAASADLGVFAVAKVSSLGVGGDVGYRFGDFVSARINFNYIGWGVGGVVADDVNWHIAGKSEKGVRFSSNFTMATLGAVLDVYPLGKFENQFARNLFVSGGVYLNWNEVNATGAINPLALFGSGLGTPGFVVGAPVAKLKYNLVSPYAGLGWQGWFNDKSSWRLQFLLGALFQGAPNISITGYNPAVPGVATTISRLRSDVKSVAELFQVIPVVSIGIGYSF
ncbi:hypothetical protein [Fundidesulfovibrio soli]|uniref:hypothetical protein n=1 Tax=Fundidesulfovibrio soli TaxID=2922716 RepID=UPI001FAF91D0|nr:hypothetical protein [Fundidesulfovibrio soli]